LRDPTCHRYADLLRSPRENPACPLIARSTLAEKPFSISDREDREDRQAYYYYSLSWCAKLLNATGRTETSCGGGKQDCEGEACENGKAVPVCIEPVVPAIVLRLFRGRAARLAAGLVRAQAVRRRGRWRGGEGARGRGGIGAAGEPWLPAGAGRGRGQRRLAAVRGNRRNSGLSHATAVALLPRTPSGGRRPSACTCSSIFTSCSDSTSGPPRLPDFSRPLSPREIPRLRKRRAGFGGRDEFGTSLGPYEALRDLLRATLPHCESPRILRSTVLQSSLHPRRDYDAA
jgi:hypothetical protein